MEKIVEIYVVCIVIIRYVIDLMDNVLLVVKMDIMVKSVMKVMIYLN